MEQLSLLHFFQIVRVMISYKFSDGDGMLFEYFIRSDTSRSPNFEVKVIDFAVRE